MSRMFRLLFIPLLAILGLSSTSHAQMSQEDMEKAAKLAQPGPGHEVLKLFVGKWKSAITAHFDPTMPMKGKGQTTNTMILGGRFLQMEGDGTMMGMKVANVQILGYDNRNGKYFIFSIDEMGTYAVTAEGDYDEATKTLTLRGTEQEGDMKFDFRFVIQFVDKKTIKMDVIFAFPGQGEQKMVEGVYTKV